MRPDAELHPLTLRFRSSEQEASYARAFVAERRGYLRVGVVLLVALYAAFGALDHAVFPEARATLHVIRYGVALPLMLVSTPFVLSRRLERVFQARAQQILFYLGFVATGGILAMGAATAPRASPQQLLVDRKSVV